eukprot:15468841-Alexandrium_andersonii.AAC.1
MSPTRSTTSSGRSAARMARTAMSAWVRSKHFEKSKEAAKGCASAPPSAAHSMARVSASKQPAQPAWFSWRREAMKAESARTRRLDQSR